MAVLRLSHKLSFGCHCCCYCSRCNEQSVNCLATGRDRWTYHYGSTL